MSDISGDKVNLERQALGELLSTESKSGEADKVNFESQALVALLSAESKGGAADVVGALSLNESKAGA